MSKKRSKLPLDEQIHRELVYKTVMPNGLPLADCSGEYLKLLGDALHLVAVLTGKGLVRDSFGPDEQILSVSRGD